MLSGDRSLWLVHSRQTSHFKITMVLIVVFTGINAMTYLKVLQPPVSLKFRPVCIGRGHSEPKTFIPVQIIIIS